MALHEMNFEFMVEEPQSIERNWCHSGVVGSGDLEILMEKKSLNGRVVVKIITPVTGFDHIWKRVIEKFITEKRLGDLAIEINDNNATPIVVMMRLSQALMEANMT